jgi:hypothetical protein
LRFENTANLNYYKTSISPKIVTQYYFWNFPKGIEAGKLPAPLSMGVLGFSLTRRDVRHIAVLATIENALEPLATNGETPVRLYYGVLAVSERRVKAQT